MEVAQALAQAYSAGRPDAENREAISKAAEDLLARDAVEDKSKACENFGEIYAYNIVWMEHGTVFATETHHICCAEQTEAIELLLADSSAVARRADEGVTWAAIINNVPFDVLKDDTVVRFLDGTNGSLDEIGRIVVADLREKLLIEPQAKGA
ncbi:hypothetical protein GOB57_21625 [Sinorhizobium meliloti]|nr:hypothetical protein [Sinorhizobium meliloti]